MFNTEILDHPATWLVRGLIERDTALTVAWEKACTLYNLSPDKAIRLHAETELWIESKQPN